MIKLEVRSCVYIYEIQQISKSAEIEKCDIISNNVYNHLTFTNVPGYIT